MKLLARIKILGNKKNGNSVYVPLLLFVIFLGSPLISIYSAQIDSNEYLKKVSDHFLSLENSFSVSDSTIPRSMKNDGSIRFVKSKDWTSGFFPGTLWQLYIFSGNKELRKAAVEWTEIIKKEQFNANDHDIGFKIMCSVGQGYRVQKKNEQREIIIQSAKTLISRFDEKIGAIKSWNSGSGKWNYPVIVDNMMNLELLFKATELTGDSIYYNIAVEHANTTFEDHYRKDESCYHVVDYDSSSGKILRKVTHQGYSDESTWARGQSWGLYGFVMTYRFTKEDIYLNKAKDIAKFLMNHPNMPADNIPYWDYNASDIPNTYRDVSAAAIMASALYELSEFSGRDTNYLNFADKIVKSIFNNYSLEDPEKPFFTKSSVGNYNKNSEINVPINYADYYFIEALMRRWAIDNKYKETSNNFEAFKLERAAFELNSLVNFSENEKIKLKKIINENPEAEKHFVKVIENADKILWEKPNPVKDIVFEGKLHSNPLRVKTMKSLEDVEKIFSLTVSYLISNKNKYGEKLSEYIKAWAATTSPTGNAINIQRVSPIFTAFQITPELFTPEEKENITRWIEEFGDSLITKVHIGMRKKSNWYAKHVKLMAMIGYITNNSRFVEHAQEHYYNYIEHSLNPDGTTYDFYYRDALHYHCSGLHALLEYLIIEARNDNFLYEVENNRGGSPYKSIEFLLPYVNGTKVHEEWVNTTIEFDRRRSISGDPEYVMGMPFEHWKALWVLDRAHYFQPEILDIILNIYQEMDLHFSKYPNWQIIFNEAMKLHN